MVWIGDLDMSGPNESVWIRHECYGDISRIMRELINRWVVPSWFIDPEFVGGTVDVPYRRIDTATGKVEELEPLNISVAKKVTEEVRSDMERDVREVMQGVAERENQHFIHQSAVVLAKRVSLIPLSPTGAAKVTVPLPNLKGLSQREETPRRLKKSQWKLDLNSRWRRRKRSSLKEHTL